MRTKENNAENLKKFRKLKNTIGSKLKKHVKGVKGNSCLNNLNFYHVTTGQPPDIMHDMLEGIF